MVFIFLELPVRVAVLVAEVRSFVFVVLVFFAYTTSDAGG